MLSYTGPLAEFPGLALQRDPGGFPIEDARGLSYQKILMYTGAMPATATRLGTAAKLFHALSDETRLGILVQLEAGERCVCELQDGLDAAQSRLSFHLKVLREAGLVTDRRVGRWSYYAIVPDVLATVHDLVVGFLPSSASTRARPRTVLPACCR
jgi:ArsR family transcriptional regulator, arsenate/arsenite/antimonite-responsive transcriptional repressor